MSGASVSPRTGLEVSSPINPAFTAPPGSYVRLIGRSGAGKSTLCLLIAGLVEDDRERHIRVQGRVLGDIPLSARTALISYVPSDPYLSFSGLKTTLARELEMASRFVVREQGSATLEANEIAEALDLTKFFERDPFSLSGGEATRASLAIALVKQPRLLVLDQMTEHLDASYANTLKQQITAMLPPDVVVVETLARAPAPQQGGVGSPPADRGWQVHVCSLEEALSDTHSDRPESATHQPQFRTASAARPVMNVAGLRFRYASSGFGIGPLDLTLAAGERLALVGPNGSGKSTLLKCLALLQRPSFERLEILAANGSAMVPPPEREEHLWAKMALYCFQRPEDQLYLATVQEELEDTASRLAGVEGVKRVGGFAARLGLQPYLEKSPYDLPRAFRRLIPLAAALAVKPPLLLFDEPTVGLDDNQVAILSDLIRTEIKDSALIYISHDRGFVRDTATSVLRMDEMPSYHGDVENPAFSPR